MTGIQEKREREIKDLDIMIVTTDTIPGRKIVETLGFVRARNSSSVSHHTASRSLEEVTESDARRNLLREGHALGANAIVGVKTERTEDNRDVTYFIYGTAAVAEQAGLCPSLQERPCRARGGKASVGCVSTQSSMTEAMVRGCPVEARADRLVELVMRTGLHPH